MINNLKAKSKSYRIHKKILNAWNIYFVTGRQYNKDGDLEQWWEQPIIDNFKGKAQCLIDQYGKFLVPEANMTVSY